MDWSLLGCGRYGHFTFAPDEPALRERLSTGTPDGPAWRCLRCGTFVPGEPARHGPAASAPEVRRGREVRSAFILRVFAVERFIRALVFGAAAYAVWRFEYRRASLEQAFDKELPLVRSLFRQLGYDIDHSKLVGLINRALTLSSSSIRLLAIGLAVYAAVELVEGTGLWLVKRWGEYFAMVATSLGLPYEIYDLTSKITATRAIFFVINLALVLYLVVAKRLFGVRGGKRAYEARLRSESIMDAAAADAAAQPSAGPARSEPAGPEPAGPEPAGTEPADTEQPSAGQPSAGPARSEHAGS